MFVGPTSRHINYCPRTTNIRSSLSADAKYRATGEKYPCTPSTDLEKNGLILHARSSALLSRLPSRAATARKSPEVHHSLIRQPLLSLSLSYSQSLCNNNDGIIIAIHANVYIHICIYTLTYAKRHTNVHNERIRAKVQYKNCTQHLAELFRLQ